MFNDLIHAFASRSAASVSAFLRHASQPVGDPSSADDGNPGLGGPKSTQA
jgi:hypothetical protein